MGSLTHPRPFGLLILLLLLLGADCLIAAEEAEPAEDGNWVERTLQRFFGNKALTSEKIDGGGLELVVPYVEYGGREIEVVIVRQVQNFEDGWDQDENSATRLLNSLSQGFQDYTRESIIRQYLLFKAGDTLVPFEMADTERLLRDLSYIDDVRIHVVPIDGKNNRVGIIVETKDRWPLGASATVIQEDIWRAKIYSSNVAGLGVSFSNTLLRNQESIRSWGYRGELSKGNIGGSFWDAAVDFEDSYRQDSLQLKLSRAQAHNGVNFIGGVSWDDLERFDNDESNRAFYQTNVWGGKVIKLYDRMSVGGGGRPVLVPAFRIWNRDHYRRPNVSADINRSYHDLTQTLASLSWQQLRSYKITHLYGEGEAETRLTGFVLKMTAGVEHREFETRPGLFFESVAVAMKPRGDIYSFGFSFGSFVHEKHFSDGVLDINSAYFTPLLGRGSIRHRVSFALKYTLGFRRHPGDQLYLEDRTGIYNLENGAVAGQQRLIYSTFYRMFTNWSLLGFRMSFFSFADLGVVGSEEDALFKKKFYLSGGLGVRLRNPALVLPTVQLRLSLVSSVGGNGFLFGVKVGNVSGNKISFPASQPGTLAYQ